MKKLFKNGTLITPLVEKKQTDLLIEDNKISQILSKGEEINTDNIDIIDCSGKFVGPGLVDIHVHGGNGGDFASEEPAEIIKGADFHLQNGTTSLTPSCLSIPFKQLDGSIRATKEAVDKTKCNILGYHVEGIYLDMEYRGGHLADYVKDPDPAEYIPVMEKYSDFITEWTMAPELPGSIELIRKCSENDIVPSAGHTQASYDCLAKAIDAGLKHTTHFCCCMSTLQFGPIQPDKSPGCGFSPGVIEGVLLQDTITTEVIADGFHLHPAYIQLALKCKGPTGVCLVSDALFGIGIEKGEFIVGDQVALVENGIAIIKDRPEIIASSVTPLCKMLANAHQTIGLSLCNAWEMATLTPARIIGVDDRKGSLAVGKDADILIMDKDLKVDDVYVGGEKI